MTVLNAEENKERSGDNRYVQELEHIPVKFPTRMISSDTIFQPLSGFVIYQRRDDKGNLDYPKIKTY